MLIQTLRPQGYVSDFAGVLPPDQRKSLENRLAELQHKTGSQFAVVTLKSLEGGQIDDFANKLFAKWGIGERGTNNGILLLVAMQDRKARVEVGYGLEPILPDALAGRVLDEELFPAFKQQRYAEGLAEAVSRVAGIVERGEPAPPEARKQPKAAGGLTEYVVTLLFLSLFIAAGSFAVGAGIRTRTGFIVLWGLLFGGIPNGIVWAETTGGGFSFFAPVLVTVFALAMGAVGWIAPWKQGERRFRGRTRRWGSRSPSPGGWWTWDTGSSDSSSGSWGGGFDSGGSFGGFGGGSSGGGGASGGW